MSRFSSFAWDLYKQSDEGKEAISRPLISHLQQLAELDTPQNFEHELRWMRQYNDNRDNTFFDEPIDIATFINQLVRDVEIPSQDAAINLFEEIVDNGIVIEFDDTDSFYFSILNDAKGEDESKRYYSEIYTLIAHISAGLHMRWPELFAPYFFSYRFDQFSTICRNYGIELPPVPGKRQERERAIYYARINEQLQKFRTAHGLTPAEFNAFLYDFAFKDLKLATHHNELPAASRVWFVIGGRGTHEDFDFVDNAQPTDVSFWQCGVETRPGDIVVLWCSSPRSCVHSIWRAVAPGFVDPFFYYYSTSRISRPIKIPDIPFSELSVHPTFADTPAVRARFQGRGGKPIPTSQYNAILEMAADKGFDTSILPSAPADLPTLDLNLKNERDVETQLIEPLLERLGYATPDYVRQLTVKIGRRERIIPDYAIGLRAHNGQTTVSILIEAKLDILSERQRDVDFRQARSYGKVLNAHQILLAARQGIWLYKNDLGDFDKDRFEFWNWIELGTADRFAELRDRIGKPAAMAKSS
ncbi:hypothetical protein EC9_05500 [Rosistilla ulvae]|uniref:Type I restriction enzyme R protein N-terminal domain-containing protein n=1 Tax=Rosistilla ulvae TaxID=1930277 RepID=A0A517LUU8_9BACT|nr:hypothetical protein [Rosistilla ulvae]QDS86388.1 hypothetical protein EC9_05500 [Rosistilla ulvae]